MNRKLLSVFFSALICSTLGHEYQRANEISEAAKNHNEHVERKHASNSSEFATAQNENATTPNSILSENASASNSEFRSGPNQYLSEYRTVQNKCSYTCPAIKIPSAYAHDDYLTLIHIEELKLIGFVNMTAKVSIVFDFTSVLILNGNTGALIWIDLETSTGFHIAAGSNTDNVWLCSKLVLIQYLKKLGSLSKIKDIKNIQKFDLKKTSETILREIITVVKPLSDKIVERIEIHQQAVISILITLTRNLAEAKDTVKLVFGKLDSEEIIIYLLLADTVTLLSGLSVLDKKIKGGLNALLTKDFTLSILISLSSGFDILIYFMKIAETTLDLTKILGDIIESPENLLEVAVGIDSGKYSGISGIIAVIYNIQLYVAKKISLEALTDIMIQVSASNNEKVSKSRWILTIQSLLNVIKVQTHTFKNEKAWASIIKFLNDVKDDKLVIGGIDVSAIINTLLETSGTIDLGVVIRLLVPLKAVVSLVKVIAVLYLRMLWFIISGKGIIFILKLFPKIKISIDFSSTKSIIQQILASVHQSGLLHYIIRLDVVGLLTHLPVIGVIFEALGEALKAVVETSAFSLTAILKGSVSIIATLKEWIWHGLGLGGKLLLTDGGIAGLSAIGGGGSVSWSSKWTSSATWTHTSGGSIISSSSKSSPWSWGWGSGGNSGFQGSGSSGFEGGDSVEGSYGGGNAEVVHPGRLSGGSKGGSGGSNGGSWSFSWG